MHSLFIIVNVLSFLSLLLFVYLLLSYEIFHQINQWITFALLLVFITCIFLITFDITIFFIISICFSTIAIQFFTLFLDWEYAGRWWWGWFYWRISKAHVFLSLPDLLLWCFVFFNAVTNVFHLPCTCSHVKVCPSLCIFSVISINIFSFVIFPELLFSSLALISAIHNLVASSFQNTGWAEVDDADSESGCNTGGLGSSFSDPCFTFSMYIKKKLE